jgi:hypothetical protein
LEIKLKYLLVCNSSYVIFLKAPIWRLFLKKKHLFNTYSGKKRLFRYLFPKKTALIFAVSTHLIIITNNKICVGSKEENQYEKILKISKKAS